MRSSAMPVSLQTCHKSIGPLVARIMQSLGVASDLKQPNGLVTVDEVIEHIGGLFPLRWFSVHSLTLALPSLLFHYERIRTS